MGDLFMPLPEQWGLRGDPFVWSAMRSRLVNVPIPTDPPNVFEILVMTFTSIVGVDVSAVPLPEDQRQVHREEFAHGGMSSGYVDVLAWQDRLLPLLVERANTHHRDVLAFGDADPRPEPGTVRLVHEDAFRAAWHDLASGCHDTIAPEATYQAWLAHFAISRLTPLHVVREVDFGARYLGAAAASHFKPVGNLMVDMLILREPIVSLPRRAALGARDLPDGTPNPRSGLGRVKDFSVITELKVSATQKEGLDYGEVVRDFRKLSAILDAAQDVHPDQPLPAAYVGVFANALKPRFNFDLLRDKLAQAELRRDVHMAAYDAQTGQVTFERGW